MGFRVAARCRFCGTKVEYFGDLCTDCDTPDRYDEDGAILDGTIRLANADRAAIDAKLDATAIGEGADV